MAFGIDDALAAIAAAINLTDTIVTTIENYKKEKKSVDLDQLLQAVKATTLQRINEADLALMRFERMLVEKDINIDRKLLDIIADTPFWRPFEQHRLNQIQKSFNAFSDAIYSASGDIAALVRCAGQTDGMGEAVVRSSQSKYELSQKVLYAQSFREAIDLLRKKLLEHKATLD